MSSDELNQSTRRDFLARVAKTGALVAPVIATFAMTSNSPVNARGALPAGPGSPADPGSGNEGGGSPADPGSGNEGGGGLPDPGAGNGGGGLSFDYRLPKPQSGLPDTR